MSVRPSMEQPRLINPGGKLLLEIEAKLYEARKNQPLWAKLANADQEVVTLEGRVLAKAGDYICRGIHGEHWPQKASKLFDTFIATKEFDNDGWQRFDPRMDVAPVQAVQIAFPFAVVAQWGTLNGKANDYFVRSMMDNSDCWIVDREIFEASYEIVKPS